MDYHKCRFRSVIWDVLHADHIRSGSSRSGGAPSQLTAAMISGFLQSGGLQRHIQLRLQPAYAARYRTMVAAMERHLVPLGVTMPQGGREIVGGYFIWFSLPEPLNANDLAVRAKEEEDVIIAQGSLFGVYGDTQNADFEREVRLCFSWEEEEKLGEGIERLGRVIGNMRNGIRARRPMLENVPGLSGDHH